MKLNPPASSSDLEAARQIARRLHQLRRREDPGGAWSEEELPQRRMAPAPWLPRTADAAEPPAELPVARTEPPRRPVPPPLPPPAARAVPSVRTEPRPAPESPRQPEPPLAPAPAPRLPPAPGPAFEALEAPAFEAPAWPEAEADAPGSALLDGLTDSSEPSPFEPEPPSFNPSGGLPEVDIDDSPLSPEEMIGEAAGEASPLDQLTEPEASPFDDVLLDAPAVAEEAAASPWDRIAETCRGLARAHGAMLVDPTGQVFSACGDWPAPGPDAIATKLVAMMAKTLKDAPTRSISAPLMGLQLTAWRVPTGDGLITAAFIGPAAVRSDARTAVDDAILGGVSS